MTTVAPALARRNRRVEIGRRIQQQGALVALVLLLVFASIRYDNFLGQNITDMLVGDVKFGLIALGMTLVIMTGGIDLSVGSVVFLGAVVAAQLSSSGLGVSFAGAVGAGAVIGAVNAVLITRVGLQPFVATLATLLFTRGLSLSLAGGRPASTAGGSGFRDAVVAGVPVAVVVGGTLLTGGVGSVLASLVGVLLLQLILNLINFENAKGTIAIGAEWAEVVQGLFLLLVVLLQVLLVGKRGRAS